jgi:hypothetical protein
MYEGAIGQPRRPEIDPLHNTESVLQELFDNLSSRHSQQNKWIRWIRIRHTALNTYLLTVEVWAQGALPRYSCFWGTNN